MSSRHISQNIRNRIRAQAQDRCGYCLSQQKYVLEPLEIEHIQPIALGGSNDEDNLWLACRLCNNYKGIKVDALDPITHETAPLFNPRTQNWAEHFQWSTDKTQIIGKTAVGRATVLALQLNNMMAVSIRRAWVQAGWHPPHP